MQLRKQLLWLVLLLFFGTAYATENNANKLRQYYHSGRYYNDISHSVQRALDYLAFRVVQNQRLTHPKKLAIVLAIDETVLSNFALSRAPQFNHPKLCANKIKRQGKDPAMPFVTKLYDFAQQHHIAIFFVTSRKAALRQVTIANLHRAGFKSWQALYMQPNNYKKPSITPFKIKMRQKIAKMGYDIVLNMSDQCSDLRGGYADMKLKVPNPFYKVL